MKELRILNGCKKGVSFILDDEPVKIGTILTNELVVQDEGISPEHIEISLDSEENVSLVPLKGKITNVRGIVSGKSMTLKEGVPFQLGITWFVAQDVNKPWPKRLPKVIEDEAGSKSLLSKLIALRNLLRTKKVMFQGIFISLVFIGINTFAVSKQEPIVEYDDSVALMQGFADAPSPVSYLPSQLEETVETSHVGMTSEAVEFDNPVDKVRAMLDERELYNVKAVLSNDQVIISGKLGATEKMVLARTLFRYEREYSDLPPIVDSTEELATELPFAIASIVAGAFGHITTRDGRRMSVGQSKQGFTLVSIKEGLLIFEGEQRVEVRW